MALLENLDMLMNSEGNFRYYRTLLDKAKPPVVPYMGLLLTDLTFMDDANLTELGKGEKGRKLLNLEKLRMLAGVFRSFRRCISKPYKLLEVRSVSKLLRGLDGFDENELYRLSKLRENPAVGKAVEALAKGSSAKLIRQITSSMLTRTQLEVANDALQKEDWDKLLAMDGVMLEKKSKGTVIFTEDKVPCLYRVKSGAVAIMHDDLVVYHAKPDDMFGEMSVLNALRVGNVRAVVDTEHAELWLIPRIVIHAMFFSDVDMSRKFYGELAQRQASLLSTLTAGGGGGAAGRARAKRPPAAADQAPADPVEHTWDVSWSTQNANQRGFTFLGRVSLHKHTLAFSSNMLGFLVREEAALGSVSALRLEGNDAVLTQEDKERALTSCKRFKCLAGFSETEQAVARIQECVSAAAASGSKAVAEPRPANSKSDSLSTMTFAKDPMALTNEDWEALTQGAKKVLLQRGEVIMKEGESYQRMYQIVRGCVRVEKVLDGESRVLTRMHCSETFGDMSFLTGAAASATCIADSDECELTILEGYYVNTVFSMRPDLAGRFYKFLAMLITARIERKVLE